MLTSLTYWHGAIYAGYGDYDANTGPIAITPFELSTKQFAEQPAFWADSERLQDFRVLQGNLYAPSIDPRIADDYSETPLSGPWMGFDVVHSDHVYDMASRAGAELWMVGSVGDSAVAWRSLGAGATWTEALSVPPMNISAGDFARFYFAGVLQNKLYVQAFDAYSGKHPTSEVFDGSGWSDGPSLLPGNGLGFDAGTFDGKLVYLSQGKLLYFDGTQVTNTGQFFLDYSVDGDKLYGLGEGGQIRETRDLRSWAQLQDAAPETSFSIVAIDGDIYVGTEDSQIYELPRQSPAVPAPSPAVPHLGRKRCSGHRPTIVGTEASDKLRGTKLADVIEALGGNDNIWGLNGNDVICGGAGNDSINGGMGNDKLYGERGKDTLNGGPGKDKLNGGAGKDKEI